MKFYTVINQITITEQKIPEVMCTMQYKAIPSFPLKCKILCNGFLWFHFIIIIKETVYEIVIFIYTAQIQRTFSNAPYNSKFFTFTILYNSQIKSNQTLVFGQRGKPEYPEKKPLGAE